MIHGLWNYCFEIRNTLSKPWLVMIQIQSIWHCLQMPLLSVIYWNRGQRVISPTLVPSSQLLTVITRGLNEESRHTIKSLLYKRALKIHLIWLCKNTKLQYCMLLQYIAIISHVLYVHSKLSWAQIQIRFSWISVDCRFDCTQ